MKHTKSEGAKERGRWSAKSKRDAAVRLLRGDELGFERDLETTLGNQRH